MTPAAAERATKEIEDDTGLPAEDPIRDGTRKLVAAVEGELWPIKKGSASPVAVS